MSEIELKAAGCPFCGAEPVVSFSHESGRWDVYEVECASCIVSFYSPLGYEGDAAKKAAIEAWNRRTPATLNETPDNFKAGAEVSSFVQFDADLVTRLRAIDEEAMYQEPATTFATVQSDAAVIERAASEAIVLIDEINKHAPSRRFNGINQPLHCKLATIRATLARALRTALDAREGG